MKIGFTGTRAGLTEAQAKTLSAWLKTLLSHGAAAAVHGDCVGADAEFDALCAGLGMDRVCRPCDLPEFRAQTGAKSIAAPEPPLDRNKRIVEDATLMLACPFGRKERYRGSGTWATIRAARRAERPLILVYPDGGDAVEPGGALLLPPALRAHLLERAQD